MTLVKDSFETKFCFYNDFKGGNASGHEMSHFCENSSQNNLKEIWDSFLDERQLKIIMPK